MARNLLQKLYHRDLQKAYAGFAGIILDNVIGDIPDLQNYFEDMRSEISPNTKVLISYHNPSWEPILTFASTLGLRKKLGKQNWIDQEDLRNLLNLAGFEVTTSKSRFFGITALTIAKSKKQVPKKGREYSVSIIVAARNEAGNISKIVPSIPKFGKWQEIIFVEGHSKDNTWGKIKIEELKSKQVRGFKQTGKGKADAVRLGLSKAKGDIVIIYDADRTVDAMDLPKFYRVLTSKLGDFANGGRLVYPMERDAMQVMNKIGNKIFGSLFTKILGQRFKDTLCGTKAFWRKDFVKHNRDYIRYLKSDPFGDFALIFTAIKHNKKVIEVPVRYKERVYGSTNINRFYHGLLLARMVVLAFKEFHIK
jgi:hypothetical protein